MERLDQEASNNTRPLNPPRQREVTDSVYVDISGSSVPIPPYMARLTTNAHVIRIVSKQLLEKHCVEDDSDKTLDDLQVNSNGLRYFKKRSALIQESVSTSLENHVVTI